MSDWASMGDAAYAANLNGTAFDAVGGYLAAPRALHPWDRHDWDGIPGPKLPIWEAGLGGKPEAESCLEQLDALGVKPHHYVAVAMETRIDKTYVAAFGAIMQHHNYKVLVYGSASTVFNHIPLNGYWVADYLYHPFMHSHPHTRITQWTDGELYDQSTVKRWTLDNFWT